MPTAAALLCAASLAVFWPGYALYDSVNQYEQALSGQFDDWHPPIMAALWRVSLIAGAGAGPMLVLQLVGWWGGLGLIAAALGRDGRGRAAVVVLAIGAMPPWLGWQVAVLKDAQMCGALLAGTGLVAWWRLRGQAVPGSARLLCAMLLGYAVLVRANAVFAVAPLVAILFVSGPWRRVGLALVIGVVALLAAGPINHRLLGAEASGVQRTEAIYDLSGIAVRTPNARDLPLAAAQWHTITDKHCVTPYFWDPLGDDSRCGGDLTALSSMPIGLLYRMLADAALAHPAAYVRHRLSHWNSTERWLVPSGWPGVAPPDASEPNKVGLATPGPGAARFQRVGGWLGRTPLGWPIVWTVLAGAVLVETRKAAACEVALALAVSALSLEASFAVLSIASDWRYHLWPTVATALALVIAGDRRPSRGLAGVTVGLLAVVLIGGVVARLLLPPAPPGYPAMLAGQGGIAF